MNRVVADVLTRTEGGRPAHQKDAKRARRFLASDGRVVQKPMFVEDRVGLRRV